MDMFAGLNLDLNLDRFKSNTNNSMRTVKDNTLTPADVTAQNLKQGIAKKTARDTSVKGVITEYRDTAVSQLDGLIGALTGGLLKTTDITKAVKVGRDGVTFSDDNIVSAIGKNLGYPVNGKSGVMRRIASGVTGEFKRITGVNIGNIITSDGSTFRTNKNWRGNVGQQVLRMVGDTVGIDKFLDMSVKGALYNNILYNAVGYGMTNSYKLLWDAYPPGFELIKRDAVLEAMKTAITNGDIESLSALLALLETEGKNILIKKYPTFIETLFSNFKFDDDVYPEDYPALLSKLQAILVGIVGPMWYMKVTAFGTVLNMAVMERVSKDMRTLLLQWDEIVPLLCCAGMFRDQSALLECKRQFKGAAVYPY